MFLFNRRWQRPSFSNQSVEERVAEMEREGLLISESFEAKRAFQVEEFEDEGAHYFIELADQSVLYLNGQYLYDYDPIIDDPEFNQARAFPCSQFTVRRHKKGGHVVSMTCGGVVLPPECVTPPFNRKDLKRGLVPEDGQILRDKSYEDLKKELLKEGKTG